MGFWDLPNPDQIELIGGYRKGPIVDAVQEAVGRQWIPDEPTTALYVSSGRDLRPLVYLHPGLFDKRGNGRLTAPDFFVYVDKHSPEDSTVLGLAYDDGRTSFQTTEAMRWTSLGTPGELLKIGISSDEFDDRNVAVLRLRQENEAFAGFAREELWRPDWFLGIRDGCAGFDFDDRCENEIEDFSRSIPFLLRAQYWVTDHLHPAASLRDQQGVEDPEDGDILELSNGDGLLQIMNLSRDWRSDVGPGTIQFPGVRIFEILRHRSEA